MATASVSPAMARRSPARRGEAWSLRGRNSRLPQDRRSGLARASAARRARRAAHRMCAVQFALISTICPSFSLNMTRTSKQELKMHAQAQPERPKGEGSSWSGAARLRQSTALPSENGPTLMSALGAVRGSSLRQDAKRQQRIEVARATLQMARVLFASNEGQMVERYRIFAFTTFYRADSMPRPQSIKPTASSYESTGLQRTPADRPSATKLAAMRDGRVQG